MREHIELVHEDNGSITVEMDLSHYLPLFSRINGDGPPLNTRENKDFQIAFSEFSEHFAGVGSEDLLDDIKIELLKNFYPEDQAEIQASPAFNLIATAYTEAFKNAIDVFLEHHLAHPNDRTTKIKLNMNLTKSADEIRITFSDSGPGFSAKIQAELSNLDKQLRYCNQHQTSQKRSSLVKPKHIGLMGGRARGLREVIAQVLSGEALNPSKNTYKSNDFESKLHFTNHNNEYCTGACIEIITQIAPIPQKRELNSHSPSHSISSHTTHSSSSEFSDKSLQSRSASTNSRLSLDTEAFANAEHLSGRSPAPSQKSPYSQLTITIEESAYDAKHLSDNAPVVHKKSLIKEKTSKKLAQENKTLQPTTVKTLRKPNSKLKQSNAASEKTTEFRNKLHKSTRTETEVSKKSHRQPGT